MKKIFISLSFAVMTVSLLVSCSKENEMTTNLQLGIKTTQKQLTLPSAAMQESSDVQSAKGTSLVLDKFLINIKEIEFEFEKPHSGFKGPHNCECDHNHKDKKDHECEITFDGPYIIDIVSPEALTGLLLGNFPLPSAKYEEIELDIAPSGDRSNELIGGRSVYISGKIGEKPFQLWTNAKAELEIEFPGKKKYNLTQDKASLWIKISLDRILSNLASIDLSSAADGNGNGIIEIGHDDNDGNNNLAAFVFRSFRGCFELDD
ncbi:MAG TPA: hypothetical protein PKL65_10100 [Bacteroidales bacterium]|jgi:hypothetical protein|nr:hypothetical protein [Bacteroidales bacterium]HNR42575.1 hypothetical protein [Bacteroidales bacterium]HQG77760.1 hypothetical protein [Bacteroidales bacterium]